MKRNNNFTQAMENVAMKLKNFIKAQLEKKHSKLLHLVGFLLMGPSYISLIVLIKIVRFIKAKLAK